MEREVAGEDALVSESVKMLVELEGSCLPLAIAAGIVLLTAKLKRVLMRAAMVKRSFIVEVASLVDVCCLVVYLV